MVFKSTGLISRFQRKIGFEKYAPSPEISAKMCQILLVWFGMPILDSFLVISWDSVHIFQNRFLRWNGEIEPVDLNTMNPIIRTIFSPTYKGVRDILRKPPPKLKNLEIKKNTFLLSLYTIEQ